MALKVVNKLVNECKIHAYKIRVGAVFSGYISGLFSEVRDNDNHSECFLKTYTGIVNLIDCSCTWNNCDQLQILDYKEVNATLTIESL